MKSVEKFKRRFFQLKHIRDTYTYIFAVYQDQYICIRMRKKKIFHVRKIQQLPFDLTFKLQYLRVVMSANRRLVTRVFYGHFLACMENSSKIDISFSRDT